MHHHRGAKPTNEEVRRAAAVLRALAEDRALLAAVDEEARTEVLVAAGRLAHPTRDDDVRLRKALRRKQRRQRQERDLHRIMQTGMRIQARAAVFIPPPPPGPNGSAAAAAAASERLEDPRDCYVCKVEFHDLHHFYDCLCPPCAELNWRKRHQSAPLDGRVALITGARIKIGYQAALILLRAGATVVATTRFPADAALRFAREPDYDAWSTRLRLYGLDLRHAPSVELFADFLARTLPRLDVLVNNAAQTVRRPPAYYAPLASAEERALAELPDRVRPVLAAHHELIATLGGGDAGRAGPETLVAWRGDGEPVGLTAASRLSQLACAPGDEVQAGALFPAGYVDPDEQQADLRPVNSWRLGAADVPTPELLEVHLVNAIAPFILASRLQGLMSRDRTDEKHIINVSAMEARFTRRKKTDKHPHTNMAKAALNMLTRTSAADYATHGIWMNSVDTGWVTDEDPLHHVARKQRIHEFFPPLDAIDGAARVLDPLFAGMLDGTHAWDPLESTCRHASLSIL